MIRVELERGVGRVIRSVVRVLFELVVVVVAAVIVVIIVYIVDIFGIVAIPVSGFGYSALIGVSTGAIIRIINMVGITIQLI